MAEQQLTPQEQYDQALDKLTAKQRTFVEHYLACLNATEAARRADYTHPNKQGPRLLVNVGIQVAVSAGMALHAMPPSEVLHRLAAMGRGSAYDIVTIYESPLHDITGQPILDKEGQPIVRAFPSLDLEKAHERGVLHLVKKVTYTAHGPSVELYDAQAALALLAKHHGLLVERVDQTGALTIKVVYADSDADTP
jgi:hypothetical protein